MTQRKELIKLEAERASLRKLQVQNYIIPYVIVMKHKHLFHIIIQLQGASTDECYFLRPINLRNKIFLTPILMSESGDSVVID